MAAMRRLLLPLPPLPMLLAKEFALMSLSIYTTIGVYVRQGPWH
jgi:hypothetical protein